LILRISDSMGKYVYQIQGALENHNRKLLGFRVLVCDLNYFDSVDVPIEIFDQETIKYLEFRFRITDVTPNIAKLPYKVQNQLRAPLGRWLDQWVLKNFHGNSSKSKDTNP
jgi:hypothetical protein